MISSGEERRRSEAAEETETHRLRLRSQRQGKQVLDLSDIGGESVSLAVGTVVEIEVESESDAAPELVWQEDGVRVVNGRLKSVTTRYD